METMHFFGLGSHFLICIYFKPGPPRCFLIVIYLPLILFFTIHFYLLCLTFQSWLPQNCSLQMLANKAAATLVNPVYIARSATYWGTLIPKTKTPHPTLGCLRGMGWWSFVLEIHRRKGEGQIPKNVTCLNQSNPRARSPQFGIAALRRPIQGSWTRLCITIGVYIRSLDEIQRIHLGLFWREWIQMYDNLRCIFSSLEGEIISIRSGNNL